MMAAADRALVVNEFDACLYPHGSPALDDAWLGIYQVLLWYDETVGLLHVNEVSALRTLPWKARAILAEEYIANALGIPKSELPQYMDRMMRLSRWAGMQRNNPLGHGYRILNAEILARWGNPALDYLEEEPAGTWFPGIRMPGRSAHPRIDVLIVGNRVPRAVFSCKWGIRHDRISDPTNECVQYKAAAMQRQIHPFEYYVITNEFDAARLEKVLDQPCVDGLIHTHIPLLRSLTDPHRDLWSRRNLFDMRDFTRATHSWS